MYNYIKTSTYICFACVPNCNFYVRMNNRKKGKNESLMYIIMCIHEYTGSIHGSVYWFISKYNCA